MMVMAVLIVAVNPGTEGGRDTLLSQALLSERAGLEIDSQGLASRVVEKKFQIHMEEKDQKAGDIPYVEVWVLNDPFYPLMGDVGTLREEEGILAGKQWQMLGFPEYQPKQETTTGTTTSTAQATGATVAAGASQRVLLVKEIYEVRGIRYATIKVNDQTYERLKAGSEFAEVFRVQEVKEQAVVVLCGDETYELRLNQLRKI